MAFVPNLEAAVPIPAGGSGSGQQQNHSSRIRISSSCSGCTPRCSGSSELPEHAVPGAVGQQEPGRALLIPGCTAPGTAAMSPGHSCGVGTDPGPPEQRPRAGRAAPHKPGPGPGPCPRSCRGPAAAPRRLLTNLRSASGSRSRRGWRSQTPPAGWPAGPCRGRARAPPRAGRGRGRARARGPRSSWCPESRGASDSDSDSDSGRSERGDKGRNNARKHREMPQARCPDGEQVRAALLGTAQHGSARLNPAQHGSAQPGTAQHGSV